MQKMGKGRMEGVRESGAAALVAGMLVVLTAAACLMLLPGCASTAKATAARFGSHTIYEDEVSDYTQSYREKNGLQDDTAWLNYLATAGQTAETWRQETIRHLADRILVQDKANELGIVADQQVVQSKIAQDKQQAGIDESDEQAWRDYLAQRGQTPEELLEDYEFSSLEQQVFQTELEFDDALKAEMCDDYIETNLADQVVCHYAAIAFAPGEAESAARSLKMLEGLEGNALAKKFEELVKEQQDAAQKAGLTCGDLGWDFTYDEERIDPDLKLRHATLKAGELYRGVLEGTDACRVVMCTEWASFAKTSTYESLESDSLKQHVEQLAMVSNWTAKCMQYLSELEEQAGIEITQMPEGLAYDVV